jgi:L-2,4-diaminobutyrate transaminase
VIAAAEFVADREAQRHSDPSETVGTRVVAALLAEGVIARAMPEGDIAGLAPPLCLTREEADRIIDGLAKAVRTVLG